MRLARFGLIFTAASLAAQVIPGTYVPPDPLEKVERATRSRPEPPAEAPAEPVPAPPPESEEKAAETPLARPEGPRIERLGNGVIVVRGSTAQTRPAAEEGKDEKPAAEQGETPPKPPREVRSVAVDFGPGGRQQPSPLRETVTRDDGVTERLTALRNASGREVPYLRETERKLGVQGGAEVSERRRQSYDTDGRPAGQEVVRIETRKLADGSIQTTETVLRSDVNGRLASVERRVTQEKTAGAVTRTETAVETPSIDGRFQTVVREQTIERKLGENRAELERTRSALRGGAMAVVEREQSVMSRAGAVSKTETVVHQRDPATDRMTLAARKIGTLTERPDGSSVERVEIYGNRTASGGVNLNATRPVLQQLVERETSVEASGEIRERTRVAARGVGETARLEPQSITERVSRPTADGEQVRTEVREYGVNKRALPARVTVEQIRK